ncbi:MAG TPA: hypothetical protein DCE18_01650 [Syntrophobacteraceae bacterium]|nr:hypothetical protein [Syntrophobacteraceae bacterium]
MLRGVVEMLFDQRDQERIRIFNDELRSEQVVQLRITADPRSDQFVAFAEDFTALAPRVHFAREVSTEVGPPALFLDKAWCYQALPASAELDPFLFLLQLLDGSAVPPLQDLRRQLGSVTIPGVLQVFIAPHCPFCPQVVKQVVVLPLACPSLHVTVIDGTLFSEMSEETKVRSAPTVILDGEFRWAGQIRLEELVDTLISRDASQLDQQALVGMLKEGNATQLAQMMLKRQQIFPAYVPLLAHEEWSVRLGAMVTLEEIADQALVVARQAVGPMRELLDSAPESIRGDVIYLLGRLGDVGSTERLLTLLAKETDEELRGILEEALEALGCRGQQR